MKMLDPSISLLEGAIQSTRLRIVKRPLGRNPENGQKFSRLRVRLCSGRHSSKGAVHLPDVEAHITGTVWKIEVEVGDNVDEGDTVVILESMKMEMPVEAEDPGVVKQILCEEGQSVSEGDTLVVLE